MSDYKIERYEQIIIGTDKYYENYKALRIYKTKNKRHNTLPDRYNNKQNTPQTYIKTKYNKCSNYTIINKKATYTKV